MINGSVINKPKRGDPLLLLMTLMVNSLAFYRQRGGDPLLLLMVSVIKKRDEGDPLALLMFSVTSIPRHKLSKLTE